MNPDYERVTADLASLVGRDSVLNPDPLNAISVEDSKFLGGDTDHTHLVKGLDYALLQKVSIGIGLARLGGPNLVTTNSTISP